jgi:CRISPR-associated endonuclease/helicase Cas3
MIRDQGVAVVTPGGAGAANVQQEIRDLCQEIRIAPRPEMRMLRALQPYTTTVHPSALRAPGVTALLRPIIGELGEPGALAEWVGTYDQDTGIDLDPHIEEFVL